MPPTAVRDLSGGMISNAEDSLLPENVAKLTLNMLSDVIGKLTQRYGTTLLGAQVSASQTCTGLFQFLNSDGTVNKLVAGFNDAAYSYDGATWTSVRSGLTGEKIRMASFLNRVFMVGGGAATRSWSGSGPFDTTNLSGAPDGQFVISFKERLFIAGNATNPDRLFFSSIASLAGVITWANTTQYIDINPEDGNNITGLAKTKNLLLIFKENSLYRFNGTAVDADVIVDIGTTSQESIANVKGLVYFFNPTGIFVTDGGYPKEISRPIVDFIKGMSASFYTETAGFGDDDHYYCSIGNVTVGTTSYTNLWLVYTVSSGNWSVFSFAHSYRALTKYKTSGGTITYVGGDTLGNVQTIFSGTTDNGSPIIWKYLSAQKEFGSRATTKTITQMATFVDNAAGGLLAVSADSLPPKPAFEISNPVTIGRGLNFRGHYFQVEMFGSNRGTPVQIRGYEFIQSDNLGYLD